VAREREREEGRHRWKRGEEVAMEAVDTRLVAQEMARSSEMTLPMRKTEAADRMFAGQTRVGYWPTEADSWFAAAETRTGQTLSVAPA